MAGNNQSGKDSQDRPAKRGSRDTRLPANPQARNSSRHPSQPTRQHVTGSGQSGLQHRLRHMSHLARAANTAAADAEAASRIAQSGAAKAHSAAYRSKMAARSLEAAVHSLEQALAVESTENPGGVPSAPASRGSPHVFNTRDIKMESPLNSDSGDQDEAEHELRPLKRLRITETTLPSTSHRGLAAPHPPPKPKLCWYCKAGGHSPLRCLRVEPGTGMTKVCPIHPHIKDHSLDECNQLLEYLTTPHLTKVLYMSMALERRGLPPIYAEAVCINELATRLGKPLDELPWSVDYSVIQWHMHSDLFESSMDYLYAPKLPEFTAESRRSMVTGPQTLYSRRPLYGDLDSLISHLSGTTTFVLDY
ncbi:hypothetical protein PG988_012103 [Apiospora saccharicola]